MFDDLPTLTHAEQQVAVEKIQKLMAEGISTAEAIKIVAQQIREDKKAQNQGTHWVPFLLSALTVVIIVANFSYPKPAKNTPPLVYL